MRSLLAQERFAGRAVSIEGTASTPLDDASVEANSADFKDGPAVCADASVHSLKHVIFSGFGTAASPSEGVQVVLYDTAAANREASELFDKCSVAQGYDFTSDTVKGSVRGADWAYLPGSLEVLYGNLHVTVIPQGGEAPQVSDAEALADAVVRQVDANR